MRARAEELYTSSATGRIEKGFGPYLIPKRMIVISKIREVAATFPVDRVCKVFLNEQIRAAHAAHIAPHFWQQSARLLAKGLHPIFDPSNHTSPQDIFRLLPLPELAPDPTSPTDPRSFTSLMKNKYERGVYLQVYISSVGTVLK